MDKATKNFQHYTPEQRADRAASHRMHHRQKQAIGEVFWTRADVPGIAFPTIKVDDASFVCNTPERKAFYKHLKKIAKALRAIEWNDSGDGDDNEHTAIMDCITRTEVLEEAIRQGERVRDEINALLAKGSS